MALLAHYENNYDKAITATNKLLGFDTKALVYCLCFDKQAKRGLGIHWMDISRCHFPLRAKRGNISNFMIKSFWVLIHNQNIKHDHYDGFNYNMI